MLTTRRVLAVCAGAVAWYAAQPLATWPAPGTVPLLDLVQLRNPLAFRLVMAWHWLAPLATGTVLAGMAASAWSLWGPQGSARPRRGSLPPDPWDPAADELSLTLGELHHPVELAESPSPRWLSLPARGLYTGMLIVGAVGSGKTSTCMHPLARQAFGWQARSEERRAAGLILEVKGDFCFAVQALLEELGRGGDYHELTLGGKWAWNPLDDPAQDSYSLAHTIGSLLNQLFGKSKEPFWQQAYTAFARAAIELLRLEETPWFTLQDIYRMAISPTGFADRLREADRRIPASWTRPQPPPALRARIRTDELAAHLERLARWRWTPAGDDRLDAEVPEGDLARLERILGRRPRRILPPPGSSGDPAVIEGRRRRRLRLEAVQRWHRDDWEQLDAKVRTSVIEGLSAFLTLFDQPEVAETFCPPPPGRERPGAPRPMPSMETMIEAGRVVALNLPAGDNQALGKVLGVLLKQSWLQALLRRPRAMADPANRDRYWRPAIFVCDEYHSFVTVGGDDPGGDERVFSLSRQSRLVPIMATQSLSSLRSAVGDREAWRTLLQTLRTRIFLSLSDEFSASEASKMCGQTERLKPNYSFSESAGRAGVSLLSGRAGGSRASLSASRSYSTRREPLFQPHDFAQLDNAQAIVQAYDGVRTLPATRLYLKPHYLDRGLGYFRQRERGLL